MPSRRSCRQTFSAPYTAKFSSQTRSDLGQQLLVALGTRRAPLRIAPPGPVLVVRRRGDRQHGADRLDPVLGSRCSSMKATITSLGGRAPPARNTPTPCEESRWRASARDSRARAPSAAHARRVVSPGRAAGVSLGLPHPLPQRLRRAAHLRRDRTDRRPLRRVLRPAARTPAAPPAPEPPPDTCLVFSMAPSSQGLEPPGNPGRFTPPLRAVCCQPVSATPAQSPDTAGPMALSKGFRAPSCMNTGELPSGVGTSPRRQPWIAPFKASSTSTTTADLTRGTGSKAVPPPTSSSVRYSENPLSRTRKVSTPLRSRTV